MRTVELLAPARDLASAIDAVDFGADAVYIGAPGFGARADAGNSVDDIATLVGYAHRFGVRVYVTMNTVLFDSEIDDARRIAMDVCSAGADALIVQDMAYCRMGLPIALHASTQCATATLARARFLSDVGFSRIVLERSLDMDTIRKISGEVEAETECFVHGALCVSESGHCFLSRSMNSRSGNRGQCAQPCRMTYDLEDGDGNTLIRSRHFLSLHDLNLSSRIGDLINAGVTSFKIEGRLKDRAYVRNTVAYYSSLIDRVIARNSDLRRASYGHSCPSFVPDPGKSFSRGFTPYFIDGKVPGVASFSTPKSTGRSIGRVTRVDHGIVFLDRDVCLNAGDGICYVSGSGTEGTYVNSASTGRIIPNRLGGIVPGVELFLNHDRSFSISVERDSARRKIRVGMRLSQISADPCVDLRLEAWDEAGYRVSLSESVAVSPIRDMQKALQTIETALRKSGDTIFEVMDVSVGQLLDFVPASTVTSLRRRALQLLEQMRLESYTRPLPFTENRMAKSDIGISSGLDNITNSVAEKFYIDHGVTISERGIDLNDSTVGATVMTTDYCLRREIGQCLRKGSDLRSELYLCRGRHRYRLEFDCSACKMRLIDCSR